MGKIGTGTVARSEAKMVTTTLKKNRDERKKTKEFLTNERNITINKDNQILLNKLVEISSGKWSSVAPVPTAKTKNRNNSVKVKGPTSLNMGVRKRETERIEKENHAFAKRLFDKQAVLKKKALDSDWADHIKYKKQIQKMAKPGTMGSQSVYASQSKRFGGYSQSQLQNGQSMKQMAEEDQ